MPVLCIYTILQYMARPIWTYRGLERVILRKDQRLVIRTMYLHIDGVK